MFKRALLFIMGISLICFAYYGRYQPVSLDLIKPSTKQVEVKGEVNNPGVVTLKWEGTAQDAIEKAGGLTETADTQSISLLEQVSPDTVLVIPSIQETKDLVSINNASLEELDTLPGVGPSIAQRIIEYRKEQPFTSLDDLKNVKGIGDKTFEKMKEQISL
ncbi:DUF655 domain-containing protein [uncultured Faecalicoccus sp.]|uniref:DUF655 domain-containing protein n=1 Tax=uncultured Faecalicoccus sp. TaxID=1971760 RepID=UPI002600846A|nr:DUF655 domain-containing protein [uncultured Faecalicoccus sp.]